MLQGKQAAAEAQAAKEEASALKMVKIQLQKVEIDKKSLQQQVAPASAELSSLVSSPSSILLCFPPS